MRKILALFVLLTSFFAGPAVAEDITLPIGGFSELRSVGQARVSHVIDPLSIQLEDGRIIRLIGIDFPDFGVHQSGDFALTAKNILKDMLEGQAVNIYQTKKLDWGRLNRMGHHIAHLERKSDQAWVQGSLVALGLARVRTAQRNPEMATQLYELETLARENKLGLWEVKGYAPLIPKDTENHISSFQIVEGQIQSAALKRNRIYLNFGKDWRTDFTVSIAPENKRVFLKQGIDPLSWNGENVRVRGWIESYNGPYMEINHPQAVEVLDENEPQEDPIDPSVVKTIDMNN